MTKRFSVILLLLFFLLTTGNAQRLKCVQIDDYEYVNFDACYLQFPGQHHGFEALYRKIERIRRSGEGVVNILHVGGSHVQAGVLSHRLRCNFSEIMPERPKSRGLMFPFKAIRTNAPTDYEFTASGSWKSARCLEASPSYTLGLSGAVAVATSEECSLDLSVDEAFAFQRLRVLGEALGGEVCPLIVTADADTLQARQAGKDYLFVFPKPAKECTIIFEGLKRDSTSFALHGVWPEHDRVGLTYTGCGINGAAVPSWLRCESFTEEMGRLCPPDLVIFGIGINDANVPASKFSAETFKANYRELINNILNVNPNTAFLFITNNDCWLRVGRRRHVFNANGSVVEQAMTELAQEFNGAIFNQFQVMGGLGSSSDWVAAGLMNRDHVHFLSSGYRLMADLIYNAFVQDYNDYLR
jgi:lysophospholipase L1-like esterase